MLGNGCIVGVAVGTFGWISAQTRGARPIDQNKNIMHMMPFRVVFTCEKPCERCALTVFDLPLDVASKSIMRLFRTKKKRYRYEFLNYCSVAMTFSCALRMHNSHGVKGRLFSLRRWLKQTTRAPPPENLKTLTRLTRRSRNKKRGLLGC